MTEYLVDRQPQLMLSNKMKTHNIHWSTCTEAPSSIFNIIKT